MLFILVSVGLAITSLWQKNGFKGFREVVLFFLNKKPVCEASKKFPGTRQKKSHL